MKRIIYIVLLFILTTNHSLLSAQTREDSTKSIIKRDTVTEKIVSSSADSLQLNSDSSYSLLDSLLNDSLSKANTAFKPTINNGKRKTWKEDTAFLKLLRFTFVAAEKKLPGIAGKPRIYQPADYLFYILAGLVFFLAILRLSFPKYFNNIFSFSFQIKFRQTQTRELLAQNRLPALLLNVYFIFSGALFITLLAQFYNWVIIDFWWLYLFSGIILAGIYLTKYLFINFTGWVFKAEQPAASYNFIVFLINKVLGIILIPFTILLAYADLEIQKVVLTVTACIVFSLLAFRYVVSLLTVKRNLNITAFHFFLYLCALEIMPMLIIYKVLFLEISIKK